MGNDASAGSGETASVILDADASWLALLIDAPMAELQRQSGSAVEDEIRRHGIQFRPQPRLGFWQDI
jgi:hypothetical protein